MMQSRSRFGAFAAAFALVSVTLAWATGSAAADASNRVLGEKLDSGLGELPHYHNWARHPELKALVHLASRVPGEKLDSGLGELPHYRDWADNVGRRRAAAVFSGG